MSYRGLGGLGNIEHAGRQHAASCCLNESSLPPLFPSSIVRHEINGHTAARLSQSSSSTSALLIGLTVTDHPRGSSNRNVTQPNPFRRWTYFGGPLQFMSPRQVPGDSLPPRNPERPVDLCGVREKSMRANEPNTDSHERLVPNHAPEQWTELHRIGLAGFSADNMLSYRAATLHFHADVCTMQRTKKGFKGEAEWTCPRGRPEY